MERHGYCVTFLVLVILTVLIIGISAEDEGESRAKRDTPRVNGMRSHRSRCVSCSVNGQLYDGHSRFQYEEGCERYRCICRCDGSYDCPARYTENICDDRRERRPADTDTSSSSSSSSSAGHRSRCQTCTVGAQEHPGHSYFTHTDGCITYDGCICYCNGSWVCPETRARNTCDEQDGSSSSSASSSSSGAETGGDSGSDREASSTDRDDRRRGYSGCQNCTAEGKVVKGNSYFELEKGCKKMRYCICRCDGSWNCPDRFVEDTCATEDTDAGQGQSGCRSCEVKGQTFPGNQYFEVTDGCIEYKNCICNCDGSWNCPDSGARNTCTQGSNVDSRSGCRECQVKGQTFPGNQYFEMTDGCIEYKNCICNCDGSWNCPDSGAKNICTQGSDDRRGSQSGCTECDVNGQKFPGNQYFEMTDGCIEYKNCLCRCDGSWSCPPEGAKNICLESDRESGGGGISTCQSCEVYGSTFPPNQYFDVEAGCMEYRNCICRCNGSWVCPDNSARNICDSRTSTGLTGNGEANITTVPGCASCYVYGKHFKGGDYFDVIHECTSYRNCICRCDGSWDCNDRFATNICDNDRRQETEDRRTRTERPAPATRAREVTRAPTTPRPDDRCSYCDAKNKVVRGNTYFELVDGCTEYKNCLCRCDGSWECPPQFAKNICADDDRTSAVSPTQCSNCVADGKIVTGNSYFELIRGCTRFQSCRCFCNGSWECPPNNAQNICFNTTSSDGACSLCQSTDGKVHPPNSNFQMIDECIEYNCQCNCNGSWNCPATESRWVCDDRCLDCEVEGRKVKNGTQFTHKTGCLEYTCDCYCNGSWSCPGRTVRNTCPVGVRDNCNRCVVSETEQYEGESDFILRQGCLHYQCRCNCDGSYTCPGKDARNVCRGEVLGGCRSCVVSETEIHKGETEFTMRKDCVHYECKCNCDGSWECPAESARNVCLGEVPGGCRVCRVNENETYRANTFFDLRQDCISYRCKCNCDGSWSCPGKDARDVCKGEVPGGCRSCIISENEYYQGNSNFEMVKNCIHYKCRCNCDGGYSCPGRTARRICGTDSSGSAAATTCKICKVSDAEQFAGNSTFYLERGCYRYECGCRCDGSWECPPEKTTDTCASDSARASRPSSCQACKIGNDVFPGDSSFKFTRRCYQFDCDCDCAGRWSCDYRNPTNICQERGRQTQQRTLISESSTSRTQQDISASGSTLVAPQSSERGNTITETDIQSRRASNSREREREEEEARRRQDSRTTPRSGYDNGANNCRQCYADGRTIRPGEVFSLDRGCKQFKNCRCECNGRWQCSVEIDNCETPSVSRTIPAVPQRSRSHQTETKTFSSSTNTRNVDTSAWVYVDGVDESFQNRGEKTGGGYVQVDADYSPEHGGRGNRGQEFGALQERPSTSFSASGLSPDRSMISRTSTHNSGMSTHTSGMSTDDSGTRQCLRCEVDTKTYPSGANFDMRRGCVLYKCLCLCSGSYRCRVTSDNDCSQQDKQSTCSNCLYQGMVFPGNMGFTVREGCMEKQCTCNCDGTHDCPTSKPIPGCTSATAVAPGSPGFGNFYPIPAGLHPASTGYITNTGRAVYMATCTTCQPGGGGGPVVYHAPVHPASGYGGGGFANVPGQRNGCTGCTVDGQPRQGNTTFTFVKDCIEFDCYCACGGAWKCGGRLAFNCNVGSGSGSSSGGGSGPGYVPGTVPHTSECRNCIVQGTEYPTEARFTLRQGCHQYQCSCNCDGGWSCPAQRPTNICPVLPDRPSRGRTMDPQILREGTYTYLADQAMPDDGADDSSRATGQDHSDSSAKTSVAVTNTCYDCEVRGVTYPPKSKFFLREGCIQRTCDCHCDRTWSCDEKTRVDICNLANTGGGSADANQCKDCRVGREVFISEKDFQINTGCYQRNCHCFCNGTYSCPREGDRNLCNRNQETAADKNEGTSNPYKSQVRTSLLTRENGDVIVAGKVPGCKDCEVDGQKVTTLSTFVRQLGCYESLCHCQCNGTPSCPPGASVNVCELPDKKPMNEREGCKVGRRVHFTRVFAHVENCLQRTCICHDNGEWTCKRTATDRKVC